MKNGPELWTEILTACRKVYGDDAVIAGGCIRDYFLGFEPKDIDIFVNRKELVAHGEFEKRDETDYQKNPEFCPEVSGVLEAQWGDFVIQIIGRPMDDFSGAKLVEKFDIGITRCWFDGEKIHDTDWAAHDRSFETLTLLRAETPEAYNSSKNRIDRQLKRLNADGVYRFTWRDARVRAPAEELFA